MYKALRYFRSSSDEASLVYSQLPVVFFKNLCCFFLLPLFFQVRLPLSVLSSQPLLLLPEKGQAPRSAGGGGGVFGAGGAGSRELEECQRELRHELRGSADILSCCERVTCRELEEALDARLLRERARDREPERESERESEREREKESGRESGSGGARRGAEAKRVAKRQRVLIINAQPVGSGGRWALSY